MDHSTGQTIKKGGTAWKLDQYQKGDYQVALQYWKVHGFREAA